MHACLPLVIVQVQQWGEVGTQPVLRQVLLNGVVLSGTSQEVNSVFQTIAADSLLPAVISDNQTSVLSKKIIMQYK